MDSQTKENISYSADEWATLCALSRTDKWNPWTYKSSDVPFKEKETARCVGNGEKKLAMELDIEAPPGGQNSTIDLVHHRLGPISVKDMTRDDCTLATEGCQNMRSLFRKTVFPLLCWCEKYKDRSQNANSIWEGCLNTLLSI